MKFLARFCALEFPRILAVLTLAGVMMGGPNAQGFPTIQNPSFEDDGDSIVWPGVTPVKGWTNIGNTGINPLSTVYRDLLTAAPQLAAQLKTTPNDFRYAFANNGKIPDGTHVFFMQSLNSQGAVRAGISQGISGFEPGKSYVLKFYAVGRAGTYAVSTLVTTLNGEVIRSGPVSAVEGADQHTQPYFRLFSKELSLPAAGPYNLMFEIWPPGNVRSPYVNPLVDDPYIKI